MRQSNFIFGALAVAFVVFITTRGSLSTYLSVIFGTAAAPASSGNASANSELSGPVDIITKGLQGSAQADAKKIIGGIFGGGN